MPIGGGEKRHERRQQSQDLFQQESLTRPDVEPPDGPRIGENGSGSEASSLTSSSGSASESDEHTGSRADDEAVASGVQRKLIISVDSPASSSHRGKSPAIQLASDVYSVLTVRGSVDARPQIVEDTCDAAMEEALLARVAAIPRGRSLRPNGAAARSMQPETPTPPVPERSLRKLFHRSGSAHKLPAPPKGIICAFCSELLHFPAQLPCGHLADLECLIERVPLDQCPQCKHAFSGIQSFMDLIVPDYILRKMEKERLTYFSKLKGRDRKIFSRTDPIRSQAQIVKKPTEHDLLQKEGQSPPHTPRRAHHRLNPLRLFRRRHSLDEADDDSKRNVAD